MKIKIFNREICVRALLDTNSLCAKSSAEMRYKHDQMERKGRTKMKRSIAGIVLSALILSLAACSGKTDQKEPFSGESTASASDQDNESKENSVGENGGAENHLYLP